MPKVTAAHLDARRNQILEAAATCFARDGFSGTTINAICEEAQLSTGAVYRYFKSKDEIVAAIAEWGRQGTAELLEATPDVSAIRSLTGTMETTLGFLHSPQAELSNRLSVLLWGEALHNEHIAALFAEAISATSEQFTTEIERGQDGGEISHALEATAAGRILAAVGLGFTVLAAIDPQPSVAAIVQTISAFFNGEFSTERNQP